MTAYCSSPTTLRLETLSPAGTVTNTLDLMDAANSYQVASLDVGFPTVRDVVAPLPTRDGDYDSTRLYGPRSVTVAGSFVPSSAGSRQKALQALRWWCQPRLRPRVVYAVDGDCAPLWLGIRGSHLGAPISNAAVSAFTAAWVAPDPVARALTTQSATINPGASGTVTNAGTYRAWPVLDVYGPCTNPVVTWVTPAAGAVVFAGLTIASGDYVEVDTNAQTALLNANPGASVYPWIDFHNTRWAGLEPGATTLSFTASSSSSPAHVVVKWADSSI
jgi:hypothetical protein